jgi:hypothetical protein
MSMHPHRKSFTGLELLESQANLSMTAVGPEFRVNVISVDDQHYVAAGAEVEDMDEYRTAFDTMNSTFDLDGEGRVATSDFARFRELFGLKI